MPTARELMTHHVEALYIHTPRERLAVVNDLARSPAPRFWLGRTGEATLWRVRDDVPDALADELAALTLSEPRVNDDTPPRHLERYRQLLSPISAEWFGPCYWFHEVASPQPGCVMITAAARFDESLQPLAAALDDGDVLAVCSSVRVSAAAHEAGVETWPGSRGQGLAGQVVRTWAAEVQRRGALALYSTSWSNAASRSVASKLGLVHYGSTFHIT